MYALSRKKGYLIIKPLCGMYIFTMKHSTDTGKSHHTKLDSPFDQCFPALQTSHIMMGASAWYPTKGHQYVSHIL